MKIKLVQKSQNGQATKLRKQAEVNAKKKKEGKGSGSHTGVDGLGVEQTGHAS